MSETQAPAFVPVIKRHVTLPVLKLEKNVERYFRFTAPMHLGKKIDDAKDAATLMNATDLATGEVGQIVVPAVLQKELDEGYPSAAYVGKCFAVKLTRVPEKRYNLISLIEIEDPTAGAETAKGSKAK